MIAKLIVHAEDREKAIDAMRLALDEFQVVGVPNNLTFLKRVIKNREFNGGNFDTSFIEKNQDELLAKRARLSLIRKGTMTAVEVWLQTLIYRSHRSSDLDPWEQRD